MSRLKEIQEMISIGEAGRVKNGTRVGQFTALHSAQKLDLDYIMLKKKIEVHESFKTIKIPSAKQMIDTFVSHLPLSNPIVDVIPYKTTHPYQKSAMSQQEFFYALLLHSMQQTKSLINTGAQDIGAKGEVFLKLMIDTKALNEDWDGEKDAPDKHSELYLEHLPIKLETREPMCCFPHAEHTDTHPTDMLEIYNVQAEEVRRVYPDWQSNVANNKPVRMAEYWSPTEKYFQAESKPLTDGVEENPFGFTPYSHVYSGWGIEDGDNTPESKAVGLIRFIHSILEEEGRQHSYLDSASAFASMPQVIMPGSREDYEEAGKKLAPHPGDVWFAGEGEKSPQIVYPAANLPAGIFNTIMLYERLLGKAQADVLRGEAPKGVEAGYPMALLIGQAVLEYGVPLQNLAVAIARALEMVRLLIRDVIKQPLWVWGQTKAVSLTPGDCEGAYRINVKFESATAEGMMNEAVGLQRLRQGGSISLRTELEMSPLVKNARKEQNRLNAESLAKHPALQRQAAVRAVRELYGAQEAIEVQQAMQEAEAGAGRHAESTGIPMGGETESELPEQTLQRAALSRRGKALRGNK